MIKIKDGADVRNLRVEVWDAIYLIRPIFKSYGVSLVITSGSDSKHSSGSFHYINLAVDLRTRDLNTKDDEIQLTRKIVEKLGDHYDVLLESDHIHLEYDPRSKIFYSMQ